MRFVYGRGMVSYQCFASIFEIVAKFKLNPKNFNDKAANRPRK